jgi:putative endonuclease
MVKSTTILGREGEALAVKELKKQSYRIIEKNFHSSRGEVDIIAKKKGVLVFIEVKARSNENFGTPFDAVDQRKQKRIIHAAKTYLLKKGLTDVRVRFDVVGVHTSEHPPRVEILVDAFFVEEI